MCMISGAIEEVSDTKIFIALNKLKNRQFTVYANLIENLLPKNGMVIPVPNPQSVTFHDLSTYVNFFGDCGKSFYTNVTRSKGIYFNSYSMDDSLSLNSSKPLEVFNVGSYRVSFAKNVGEIKRIDESEF